MTFFTFGIVRYGVMSLFGVLVATSFAGMEKTKKNFLVFGVFSFITILLQATAWRLFGISAAERLYPFIVHLPLSILIVMYLKRSWLISFVSVFSAYLCCQAPRWIGSIAGAIFDSKFIDHITCIVAAFITYYFLQKYVSQSVYRLMNRSKKSCMLFGAVPFLYYLFDYTTTVYTHWLYEGAKGAVQFMPSVVSIFYFVFVILYYNELQKQTSAQRERTMLDAQLQQAHTEFETLREMQQNTMAYRHDMRHHFSFLQGLAESQDLKGIKNYLKTVQSDLDAITPVWFCENDTVNLILSYFAVKTKQKEIALKVEAKLPSELSLSSTELCSLLSNGLENAITATCDVSDTNRKIIVLKAWVHKNKLLFSIQNPYDGTVTMKDGKPLSVHKDHGYGTASMSSIADSHGGQALFNTEDGKFNLKIMIPLDKLPENDH